MFWLLSCSIHFKKHKNIFTFCIISQHWYGGGHYHSPSWKTRPIYPALSVARLSEIFLKNKVNTMAADALAPCVARSSAAMVLILFTWNLLVSVPKWLKLACKCFSVLLRSNEIMVTLPRCNLDLYRLNNHLSRKTVCHDGVVKWKHFLCYWPFVRGIQHWSPVYSPHKDQWCRALMFSTNSWQTIKMPVIWDATALIMMSL